MIFKGSRYENLDTVQATDANGRTVTALKTRVIPKTPATYQHTFIVGDRLDLIAFRFYGNAEKFWRIADANTEMDAEDLLVPGRKLLIPPDKT